MERFKDGLDRRAFLKATLKTSAAAALLPLAKWVPQTAEAKTAVTTPDPTKEFIEFALNTGGVSRWGYRLTEAWEPDEGTTCVAFQRAIFKKGPDGNIGLRNILDELSYINRDERLASGEYGVVIPPVDKSFILDDQILPPAILQEVDTLRRMQLDPGNLAAPVVDFGPFKVARFQRIAIQEWPDNIEYILIGDAMQRMGFLPQEAILPVPQLDGQPDPLGCEDGPVQEGEATYYTVDGCVGCRFDRKMANGERLRDDLRTLASISYPLNTTVEVTNLDTGLSTRALVTDRGGFWRYGYVADLSLGTRSAIMGSDITRVRISPAACR